MSLIQHLPIRIKVNNPVLRRIGCVGVRVDQLLNTTHRLATENRATRLVLPWSAQ